MEWLVGLVVTVAALIFLVMWVVGFFMGDDE